MRWQVGAELAKPNFFSKITRDLLGFIVISPTYHSVINEI
tara:strand:+ start:1109 stop:1228 length:120 start_codon:yes stop_codon:yes gene_type:complete